MDLGRFPTGDEQHCPQSQVYPDHYCTVKTSALMELFIEQFIWNSFRLPLQRQTNMVRVVC